MPPDPHLDRIMVHAAGATQQALQGTLGMSPDPWTGSLAPFPRVQKWPAVVLWGPCHCRAGIPEDAAVHRVQSERPPGGLGLP